MTDPLDLAGEKEPHDGEGQDPAGPPEVPFQEGQPQSPTPRRRGRPKKQAQEVVLPNPACSNPACIVTCSPQCENLHDWVDYNEYKRAEREHEMGSDPTLRSKDVI